MQIPAQSVLKCKRQISEFHIFAPPDAAHARGACPFAPPSSFPPPLRLNDIMSVKALKKVE